MVLLGRKLKKFKTTRGDEKVGEIRKRKRWAGQCNTRIKLERLVL